MEVGVKDGVDFRAGAGKFFENSVLSLGLRLEMSLRT